MLAVGRELGGSDGTEAHKLLYIRVSRNDDHDIYTVVQVSK